MQLGLLKQVHKKPFTVDEGVALLAFCTEV